jgi:iron complex outermembrane receptor protein
MTWTPANRPPRGSLRSAVAVLAAIALGPGIPLAMARDAAMEGLAQLSLEQLGKIRVTSVSKTAEPVGHAPASIYVITHDEIIRSGAATLAEALRLAPNLQVTQLTSSSFTVAARGFAGNPSAQSFSNKMLILIDGRSIYNPLFSGVYLEAQSILLDDVDRIEVLSGPGAALWGSNAVNGIINVITRPSYLTQGGLAGARAGNLLDDVRARYGGRVGDDATFRVYAKAAKHGAMDQPDGASALDSWYKMQGGFRFDWSHGPDQVTASGDTYKALEREATAGDRLLVGADVLTRWRHRTEHSDLQLQAYYDMSERAEPFGGGAFVLHTYDVEVQQRLDIGSRNVLLWGAGERANSYGLTDSALAWQPTRRTLTLESAFLQDTLTLGPGLEATAGLKVENDPYAGWQFQPDVRLAWSPRADEMLWAAVSRAVRTPTPFEEDVVERIGPITALTGNRDFQPERVTAYEVGYRGRPSSTFSLSVTGFYNVYGDLRSIETTPVTFFPLTWGNSIEGHTFGIEAWADWQATSWWRLSPGFTALHESLRLRPGASTAVPLSQETDDPSDQFSLESSMNLRPDLTLDARLRYVGALPDPALAAYTELSARVAWQAVPGVELSLVGRNLLHERHLEFPAPDGEAIARSVYAGVAWRF